MNLVTSGTNSNCIRSANSSSIFLKAKPYKHSYSGHTEVQYILSCL
jgi:hypothetical protein